HPGTQEDILQHILNWALNDNDDQNNIYWLYGPAGVGKSVIAKTVAIQLEEEGKLGASFFFSRTDPASNNVSRLFTTIAYKLAISSGSPDLWNTIEAKIEHDPSIVQQSMEIQWKRLVVEPLKEVSGKGVSFATALILIDGLDECENDKSQLELLELLDQAEFENLLLCIIVSSHPESHIQD
ncbi:hypothetical protein BDQ17DRAFT_1204996, partial [Cyathus striatus]